MMGSFITRGVIMLLGYVYPAYECFKIVERNRPEIESLRFWCQYWIIIAVLTVFERVGDVFVSWVPMYSEAKLAFIIYLWYPKTLAWKLASPLFTKILSGDFWSEVGTNYVYATFLRPFVVRHEAEIDRQLNELTTRAGDLAFFWWQRGSVYIQARFYELLAYVASQSNRTQQGSVPRQVPPVARQAPPPRPNAQVPRGPPRDPQQGGPQVYPPLPSTSGFPGSAPGGAGYPPVNVDGVYPPAAAAQPGPALYPPPPGPHSTGSVHRRRESGTGGGSGSLSENSDSDYDVIDRQEGRPESNRSQQPNPSVGEQDVPLRVYNTRNRRGPSGSRNWSEWLYSWVDATSSGKDD